MRLKEEIGVLMSEILKTAHSNDFGSREEEGLQRKNQCKVLVGDDTASTLHLAARCLEFDNYKVATAKTAEEIIVKSLEWEPNVVLLDLMLPGCNGLNLIRSIKHPLPETKVCVMSVIDDYETIQNALELGADDYIVKPICPDMLAHKISLLTGTLEGKMVSEQNCDLNIHVHNDLISSLGRVVGLSPYMLKVRLEINTKIGQLFRCRCNALNKIMERKGDFFVRVCFIEGGVTSLEMVGVSQKQMRMINNFAFIKNGFNDLTFLN